MALVCFGESISPYSSPRRTGSRKSGDLVITFTVKGSTISVPAIVLSSELTVALVSGFVARSRVNLTESALKSSPLWNFTPLRKVNCQVVAFSRFQDSARAGTRLPSPSPGNRSEEHTSELQSRPHLVCRLLLEKNNTILLLAPSSP